MADGFQVRDETAETVLRDIGRIIKDALPPHLGFTLLIYDYGEGGNMFYLSSAQREDMINSMKEFIEKQSK